MKRVSTLSSGTHLCCLARSCGTWACFTQGLAVLEAQGRTRQCAHGFGQMALRKGRLREREKEISQQIFSKRGASKCRCASLALQLALGRGGSRRLGRALWAPRHCKCCGVCVLPSLLPGLHIWRASLLRQRGQGLWFTSPLRTPLHVMAWCQFAPVKLRLKQCLCCLGKAAKQFNLTMRVLPLPPPPHFSFCMEEKHLNIEYAFKKH